MHDLKVGDLVRVVKAHDYLAVDSATIRVEETTPNVCYGSYIATHPKVQQPYSLPAAVRGESLDGRI